MNHVVKNYIYNLFYQILLMFLPIITTPYVSRVLLAEGVGKYNYAFSVISVTLIMAQLGTNMYGQREIAYIQKDKHKRSKVFWEVVVLRIVTTTIIAPFYLLLSFRMHEYTPLLLSMTVYLLSNIFDCSWYFQGIEEFKKTAMRSIASKILGVVLIFIFVNKPSDVVLYAFILGISQLIGNVVLLTQLRNSVERICFCKISISKHIRPVFSLFIPTAAIYVYTYVDKILLGIIAGDLELGFYSQAEKIVKLLMTIITALGSVMLPHIAVSVKSKDYEKIRSEITSAIRFIVVVGIPMVVVCLVVACRFIPWFLGEGYEASIGLFKLLSPLIVIIGTASIIGQAVLIPLKKQRIYTFSIVLGAFMNLVFNLALIPRIGAVGAAIGTLVAELTVTCIQFIAVSRYIELDIVQIMKMIIHYFPANVIMAVIGFLMNMYLPNEFMYLVLIVVICIFVYGAFLLIVKDTFIISILKNMR